MNKIDLQARRIVTKALQEGGGAGIEIKLYDIAVEAAKAADGTVTVTGSSVEKFDMHGYQDGHSDFRGDLIKITAVNLPEDAPPGKYRVTAGEAHQMVGGGYIRGSAEQFLPVELKECDAKIEQQDGDYYVEDIVIFTVAAAGEDFIYAYKDTFEDNYPSDEERADEEYPFPGDEEWHQNHHGDISANYGWTDPNKPRRGY